MAENQNENEVNNAKTLADEVITEQFIREDLKQVAETTSLFDSLKDLKEMSKSRDDDNEAIAVAPKTYTGRKYHFIISNDSPTFLGIDPSDEAADGITGRYSEEPISNHYVVTVNNGKSKGIKQDTIPKNASLTVWQSDYKKIFQRLIKNYPSENMPQVQEFFTRFANALMFELSKNTKSDIKAYARIKSQYSFLGKCFYRASAHNKKPINDLFGMKLVLDATHDGLPFSDPLMQQKRKNDSKIDEFQQLVDEYIEDPTFISGLNTSTYYSKFIELLDSLKEVVSPKATEYKAFIESKKQFLQEKLTRIKTLGLADSEMSEAELKFDDEFKIFYDPRKKYTSDFAAVLSKYRELNDDLINYPILCNQVKNVFQNSKIIGRFGVSIVKEEDKENDKGYKAKFIVLDTPVGRMEVQLQTDNQMKEGMTGFNAHDKFKSIPPLPIIPPRSDKKAWNKFLDAVDFISPFAFTVQEDDLDPDELTMKTTYDSRHLSLKKVIQVSKESPIYSVVNKYLGTTYDLLSDDAQPQESLQLSDIVKYLNSERLKELKDNSAKQKAAEAVQQGDQIGGSAPTVLSEGTISSNAVKSTPRKDDGHGDMDI